jgi:hypothetical protein
MSRNEKSTDPASRSLSEKFSEARRHKRRSRIMKALGRHLMRTENAYGKNV